MVYRVYEILSGDTLESISRISNMSFEDLVRLNGFDFSDFNVGDMIVIPSNDNYFVYRVKSGDTMYSIANSYNQNVDILYSINGIKENDYIYPDQELLIPNDNNSVYVTKTGDTLEDISVGLDVPFSDVFDQNRNLILESDQIVVYKRD